MVESSRTSPIRFFTLADSHYFPGLVALVNSLRLLGHQEPVTVIDLGLEPAQREVLRAECDIVPPPAHSPRHPWLLESRACTMRPAEIVVYVDADIILAERLDTVFRAAREGKVVAYADVLTDRRYDEWAEVFGLHAPVRPPSQVYANAGFVAFSTVHVPDLLPRWAELCDGLVGKDTHLDTNSFDSPIANSSQDALNALLMSEIPADRVEVRAIETVSQGPNELTHTEVVDVRDLWCRREGRSIALLHGGALPSPGTRMTARRCDGVRTSRACAGCSSGPTSASAAPDGMLPIWLRSGVAGRLSLWYLTQARRPWRGPRERAKGLAEEFARRLGR